MSSAVPLRRIVWTWALGGLLLLATLIAVDRSLGLRSALRGWSDLGWATAAAALACLLLSYLTRAQRVRRLPLRAVETGLAPVFRLVCLHTAVNNLLPMRSGELAFPVLMRRQFGVGYVESAAQLLWLRLLDLQWIAALGAAVLLPYGMVLALAITLLPLGLVPAAPSLAEKMGSARRWQRGLQTILRSVPAGRVVLEAWTWTALGWIAKGAALWLLYRHFAAASAAQAAAAIIASELTSVLPINGIAGAGSYEAAAVAAGLPLGLAPAESLRAALNAHVFLLATSVVLAVASLRLPERPASSHRGHPIETSR